MYEQSNRRYADDEIDVRRKSKFQNKKQGEGLLQRDNKNNRLDSTVSLVDENRYISLLPSHFQKENEKDTRVHLIPV